MIVDGTRCGLHQNTQMKHPLSISGVFYFPGRMNVRRLFLRFVLGRERGALCSFWNSSELVWGADPDVAVTDQISAVVLED